MSEPAHRDQERSQRVRAGDRREIARLIRALDDGMPEALQLLRGLQSARRQAGASSSSSSPPELVVGITGGPGAGKSTLVDALVAHWRAAGDHVGVVAIDPTSPVAGGAVLGDRIRMQRHALDAGVFIRSVASRGTLGGLSHSVANVVAVLKEAGFPRVIVETVGAGQAEVDIASVADVTVVVVTPGMGDDVQMLKAGILEIADVLVLNKADRPGADATLRELQAMLGLRQAAAGPSGSPVSSPSVEVAIVSTVATTGEGVAALASAIGQVFDGASRRGGGGDLSGRALRRAEGRIRSVVLARLDVAARRALADSGAERMLVEDVAARRLETEAAADALMARLAGRY